MRASSWHEWRRHVSMSMLSRLDIQTCLGERGQMSGRVCGLQAAGVAGQHAAAVALYLERGGGDAPLRAR